MMTNLFTLPITILLIQLFKRSKRRVSRNDKLNKILHLNKPKTEKDEFKDINEENQPKPKPKRKLANFMLPWWCKIIAYILSFAIIGVSSFFIFVKGIALSNDTVAKWLSSLLVSIISSIVLVQPLKVSFKLKFLYLRKYNIK